MASWPRCRPRVSPARCRCRVRTATRRPSTGSRSARRPVDVWKDARELGKTAGEAAIALCTNPDVTKVSGTAPFTTPGGNDVTSILLTPQPITKDNLNVVIDAGWTTKENVCKGVAAGSVPVC